MFDRESESYGGFVFAVWVILLLVISAVAMPPVQTGEYGSREPTISFAPASTPDQYGQYITAVEVETNVTGSWANIDGAFPGDYQGQQIDWNASQFIRLKVQCLMNSTLTGVSTTAEGKAKIRHNVTVVDGGQVTIWSQQNFTYVSASDVYAPMFWYEYSVILNFEPQYWTSYTVTITYEVYYAL